MIRNLQVSRDIAADPMAVWSAVSDVTNMGQWSTECHTCAWQEGHDGPVVGAVFNGENRNGEAEWTTQAVVTAAEPGESFHFDAVSRDFVFAKWGYNFEAIDGGTRVTEVWEDLRPEAALERSAAISGVADRAAFNQVGMETTLERLAAAVES